MHILHCLYDIKIRDIATIKTTVQQLIYIQS